MSGLLASGWGWELLLRGAVGGVLMFHLVNLLLPGPRGATRAALAVFTLSLIGYLFCQRAELLFSLPRPLALVVIGLCVSTTAWLWLAARGLFDDRFRLGALTLAAPAGLVALGMVAHVPRMDAGMAGMRDQGASLLTLAHAGAMLVFTFAALWEVARGWRDDLVEPRRATRRWMALGIGVYAAIALIVELALRGRMIGALLPALHVAGIGALALGLALLVAHRSLNAIVGDWSAVADIHPAAAQPLAPPAAALPEMPQAMEMQAPAEPPAPLPVSAAMAKLDRAMTEQNAHRREGLTLAALAQNLDMGEAALRSLINQELGYRNFNDFLHRYRLQEAAGRLEIEELPILTIALDCGYGSIGPFNRAFRQRFGMTPTEFRASARMRRLRQTP